MIQTHIANISISKTEQKACCTLYPHIKKSLTPFYRASSFFCFSIMELKPPMVSASSPLIEPLRSRMNTISVKFFLMFSTSVYKKYDCLVSHLTVILYFGIHFIWSHGKRHYSSDENSSPSILRTSSVGILVPSRMVIRRSKSSIFLTAPTADTYFPPAFRSSGWK